MTTILCPLCSQSQFDTLDTLRSRLVRAATQNITCPICQDVLLGLDKFTIHLFGHSLAPTEPQPTQKTATPPSTVNIDDLSFLTSWENCEPEKVQTKSKDENAYKELHLEIKLAPGVSSNFSPALSDYVDPRLIHEKIDGQCFTEPRIQESPVDSPPFAIGEANFLMTPSPKENQHLEEDSGSQELSHYMDGLLKLETGTVPSEAEQSLGNTREITEKPCRKYEDICNNSQANITKKRQETSSPNNPYKDVNNYLQALSQQYPYENIQEIREKLHNLGIFIQQKAFEQQIVDNVQQRVDNVQQFLLKTEESTCEIKGSSERKRSTTDGVGQKVKEDEGKSQQAGFGCGECGKTFRMRGSVVVHSKVAHGGRGLDLLLAPRTFQCLLCPKTFKKEQHLTQHVKTHEGKQWQCEICSKFFTTKYFLKKHQRLHTGEMPYCCEACGKTFTFQQSYHKHLLYHSADKPHECRECGRSFKELSTLHNHQRIHSGEKPFACETCGMPNLTHRALRGKCFRQRVSYIVHQRIHTGVLPYQCTACYKKFRYKVSQRSHKCPAQPPGIVVRQPGDLIQRLLEQRGLIQPQVSKLE